MDRTRCSVKKSVRYSMLLVLCACGGSTTDADGGVGDAMTLNDGSGGDTAMDTGVSDASVSDVAALDAAGDVGPVLSPGPRYVGRVDDSDPEAVRFGWSGTGVVIRFDGTGARARLRDSGGFLTVVVDGVVGPRIELGGGERFYELASELPAGEHVVELYKRTEGFLGTCFLTGIEVDGELLAVPAPTRSIEVVGDSISCGYGNEGADEFCSFSADTENHYMTYAAIAARSVQAELSTIAWSGKGVVANYGDDRVEPMPELYDRLIPEEEASYNFERTADVVLINLGTNDFSTDGDPSADEFTTAYTELLAHIRERHPSALIFGTIAPGLGGDDYARAYSYVQAAVQGRTDAGDSRVRAVDLRVEQSGFGCDYHPSIATHEAMATRFAEVLNAELGW